MSPHLKDLIIELHKKGLSEDQIFLSIQKKELPEPLIHSEVYHVLAEYRMTKEMFGDRNAPRIGTRIWGAICLLIGILLTIAIIISLTDGRTPGPFYFLAAFFMTTIGFRLIRRPNEAFDTLD